MDELLTTCSENLNSLTALKMSTYYKTFEENVSTWEGKLNQIRVLFDIWIIIQHQWVYLKGIFSRLNIRHLLLIETSCFHNINTEFLDVIKKVYKSPFIIDVLNIPNVQKLLERLSDLLSKIYKTLGKYLEREFHISTLLVMKIYSKSLVIVKILLESRNISRRCLLIF